MMSCCSGRDAMWIDFQTKAENSREFFAEIEEMLRPIGFRKHWAKGLQITNPEHIADQFNKVGKFLELMMEFDPKGKFRNSQGEFWYQEMKRLLHKQNNVDDIE